MCRSSRSPFGSHILNSFTNVLLLYQPHHSEVDDKKTGEKLYPPELLRQWKTEHEGGNGPALARLGPVDEDALAELLASAFEPPIKRLEKIAHQLEKTGTLNASAVSELRRVIGVLVGGPDRRTAHLLMSAADMLSARDLRHCADPHERRRRSELGQPSGHGQEPDEYR